MNEDCVLMIALKKNEKRGVREREREWRMYPRCAPRSGEKTEEEGGAVLSRRLFMANFKPLSVVAVIINKRHYAARRMSRPSTLSLAFKGAKVNASVRQER